MSSLSLIQFEDQDGKQISEVLQVPNSIEIIQMKSLINTTLDLFINGNLITNTLESCLTVSQLQNVEEIKKIRLSEESPAAKPALYCSSTYSGHQGPVLCTRFAKDVIVTTGGDKTVRFWDVITKTQFKIVQKHSHWVIGVDFNKNHIVSCGMDGLINVYDHRGEHLRTLAKHRDAISALRVDEKRIISCSRDATCIVWDISGVVLATWSHSKPIRTLCVYRDLILTGGSDRRIIVWKGTKYHCDLTGHSSQVNCIEAHGDFIISGDDNGQIILWKDFQAVKRLQHKREVLSLCFSPNGLTFASASFDRTVKLWSTETGECLCTYYHVHFVYKVRLYSDLIISCSKDKTIKMYRISKKKVISDLICEDEVYDFDYCEGKLICGTRNGKVHFFN